MSAAATPLLIYGANGYTGRLIVAEAVRRGLRPILSGRNAMEISAIAAANNLEARPASLDDAPSLDRALAGCTAVIHCAGPFSRTANPMVEACLRNKVHYLDITGEIAVFEGNAARSARAVEAGTMLLSGVGFDVVPSDCLAAHLKRRLPSASWLTLAFFGGTGFSRGTATTMIENIDQGGAIRRGGKITRVRAAWRERDLDFGDKVRHCVTIPWGDVSTAFHSAGIPNIEVYAAVPASAITGMKFARIFGGVMATSPVQALLKSKINSGAPGPSDEQRSRATARLWGEAWDDFGNRVRSRLQTPDGYTLTALTAIAAAENVLSGAAVPGFQTPSKLFGPDFILEIAGTSREDIA